jgi:hypothetical protein
VKERRGKGKIKKLIVGVKGKEGKDKKIKLI